MKLAISNIAWAADEAEAAYALLQRHDVRGLEIAPGLAFPQAADPFAPSDRGVAEFKAALSEYGLGLVSMQSLLFGTIGAQLFGTSAERSLFEAAIGRALILADRLDIPNLVFGSPANRSFPSALTQREALEQATETFWRLGERAQALGRTLAIEPNPAAYGTNFLTTIAATASFVIGLGHPAISLNFDIGAVLMNNELVDVAALLARSGYAISHVHISEPGLAPAPVDNGILAGIAQTLSNAGYNRWYSIEMRRPGDDALSVLDDCIRRAKNGLAQGLNASQSHGGSDA